MAVDLPHPTCRAATPGELDVLAALAERCQRSPERGIPYLGDDAASIAADVLDVGGSDTWCDRTVVAAVDDRAVGWLFADRDADKSRVWWFGPFVDPELDDEPATVVADALLAEAAPLRSGFAEEEMCYDQRSGWLAAFARRHDFVEDVASLDLRIDVPARTSPAGPTVPPSADVHVPEGDDEIAAVVALHDELFAGTHLDGHEVAMPTTDERITWCCVVDDVVVGYVAVEHQHDHSLYIDFLGVSPDARQRGTGTLLVRHALEHGARLGVSHAHLTVRSSNAAARRLYESLGFSETMVIVPARKGFLFGGD